MKKILNIFLGGVMAFATVCMSGCNKKVPDSEQTLQIYAYDAGYGTIWCDAVIDEFKKQPWVQEKYPNLEVLKPTYNDVASFTAGQLNNGDRTTYDLMFGAGLTSYFGDTGAVLDLTEVVYNQTVPGEDVLFSEKMNSSYKLSSRFIDVKNSSVEKYYFVPWAGGMGGIIYNEDILNSFDLKVPNTTNELIEVCETIMNNKGENNGKYNKGYSFLQARDAVEYFEYLLPIWWAQYEGTDRYLDFWNGIDNNRYSSNIFYQQGRRYALEVMATILDYEDGYLSPDSFNLEFMPSQLAFFNGNAVFHVNGDWLENEMRDLIKDKTDLATFKTMRTPIISELGVKLGITDSELSALVDYIDGVGDKPTFVSTEGYTEEDVIAAVTEARSVVQSIGPNHHAVIPKNANGKDVAIDFLRFLATDIAQRAYMKSTGGNNLPFEYNVKEDDPELYNSFSSIHQSRIDYFFNGSYETYTLPSEKAFPLYIYGELAIFSNMNIYTTLSSSSNTMTPDDFMQDTIDAWTADKWDRALTAAGIK